MIGPKAFLTSSIARALAAFLEVDPGEIETSLLGAGDKSLTLQHVALKKRRIRVRSREGVSTFLVLSGSFDEVAISWSWSSGLSQPITRSLLAIKGIRLQGHFEFEQQEEEAVRPTDTDTINPVAHYFKSLWTDTLTNLKNSAKFRQFFSDFVDTLSIQLTDLQFRLILPDDSNKTELVLVLDYGAMDALKTTDLDGPQDFLLRPLNIDVSLNALSLTLAEGLEETTILDPFTYAASIRRIRGTRFTTMESGYEIIGRERQTRENAAENNTNEGVSLHIPEEAIFAIAFATSLFRGTADLDPAQEKNLSEHSTILRDPPKERSRWLFRAILMLVLLALGAFSVIGRGFVESHEESMLVVAAASLVVMLMGWRALEGMKGRIRRTSRSPPKRPLPNNPARFRIPLPFISVVGPMGVSVTLSDVSIVGRLDGEIMYIVADSLSCTGTDRPSGPLRASARGIRSSLRPNAYLLNIDTISELFYPGRTNLVEPIEYSAVRFENGVLTTRLRSLVFQMLSRREKNDAAGENAEDLPEDPLAELGVRLGSFVEKTRGVVHARRKQINKGITIPVAVFGGIGGIGTRQTRRLGGLALEEGEVVNRIAREQLNSEIFARLMTLKAVAEMFEKIPLNKNRYRLRIFPNTFRGNEAVDYLLASKIADNRYEATKVLRDIQVRFSLFEHVTKEHNFLDDPSAVFKFVALKKRRMWESSSVPFKYTEVDQEKVDHMIPFPLTVFYQELVIRSEKSDDEPILCLRGGEIYTEPAKLAHANVINTFYSSFESRILQATNVRVHCVIDPDLVREIHGLEVSVDTLRASPEYSVDDWYEKLGFVKPTEDASENKPVEKAAPFSFPYMHIAPFNLRLSWKGVILATKETSMKIEAFHGDGTATSNDLINYFVKRVLSRAPGLLVNFRVLGVNVMEKSGIVSTLAVGAKLVPFGQYLAIGGMALFDGVTAALDNGKVARDDAGGSFKPGDLFRGVAFSAQETARHGAHARGKVNESCYDEEDEVQLDPVDFAVGATQGTAKYVYGNKARYTGAAIAGGSLVALTVATGPVGGIILGVMCGVVAEKFIKVAEKRFENRVDPDDFLKPTHNLCKQVFRSN